MLAGTNERSKSADATQLLLETLRENRLGHPVGVYCVCSANRYVLEAGMVQAKRDNKILIIESTSNQVNQFGGYTGQTPAGFAGFVRDLAKAMGFPFERIVLGGDHLGPHVWRKQASAVAMTKAHNLVRDCVLSGYTKIHLDASMDLGGDSRDRHRPLSDEIVSARAAELCRASEEAHRELPAGSPQPVYVIGTEVPIPGGEIPESHAPEVTRAEDVERTLELAKEAFRAQGLDAAWERVIGVVVQPGVEFGDSTVFPYDAEKTRTLSQFVVDHWHGVYEAHSTDYQSLTALRQLVENHFAILKVGPWLTFALREAVFALAQIEEEWLGARSGVRLSAIRETLERVMIDNPVHWKSYYRGDEAALRFARVNSYSDRIRYYWPQPNVVQAFERLIANLTMHPAPVSLLSQYFAKESANLREGTLAREPLALIRANILRVLDHYADACGMKMRSS